MSTARVTRLPPQPLTDLVPGEFAAILESERPRRRRLLELVSELSMVAQKSCCTACEYGCMRVRFPRLDDGKRSYSVVERADGVRYRVHEGVAGPDLPHDLVHFIVEREMGEDGGFWGAVAAGAVFDSMQHIDGRRPPHARERSELAIRARSDRLQRAELMAGLVEHIASERITSIHRVAGAAKEALSTLPEARVDESRVIAAAKVLQDTAGHWATLTPGDELVVDWPEKKHRRRQ